MTKKDYLTIWGYLEALKSIYQEKARTAATRKDDIGRGNAGDYLKWASEIAALQSKIDAETEGLP